MTRTLALLALSALLAACSGEEAKAPVVQPTAKATPAPALPVPPPSTARDPKVVLQAWAEAMSVKDWDAAYPYWEAKGVGTGMNLDQFKAQWGRLANPEFEIHPGRNETAAGSRFYTAPVVLIDGARRIEGQVVLRRLDAASGASEEDQRWHVESHTLEF
jgi:hypothetical protein